MLQLPDTPTLMFRFNPRVLSEFVLHKWADTEHYKFSYFNSEASAEQHGGDDEDADLQGAAHDDAALASSDDDADVASVETDDSGASSDGANGAHAPPEDEFA